MYGPRVAKLTDQHRAARARARAIEAATRREVTFKRQREKRQAWDANDTRLTYEQYQAGVSCKACGHPVLDGRGDWPPMNAMTAGEAAEHSALRERLRTEHADCELGVWSVVGHRTLHCGECCPPPPPSSKQIETISRLFSITSPQHEMDTWKLELSCGHFTETRRHMSDGGHTLTLTVVECGECDDYRGVIDTALIHKGTKAAPPPKPAISPEEAQAVADVESARRLLKAANRRLRQVQTESRQIDA